MFSSVNSIFEYSGQHRALLLRAKDSQDPVAIAAFHQVYVQAVNGILQTIVANYAIDLVVLPRMSVRRIANLDWHPNDFWKSLFKNVVVSRSDQNPIQVFMRTPAISRKRALLSSIKRRSDVLKKESFVSDLSNEAMHSSNNNRDKAPSVLFVDDVLTSGGTLLKELDFVYSNFQKMTRPSARFRGQHSVDLPLTLNAHILTLFRTPVSAKAKGIHS
ncbi:MAG: hypothetical protein RI953_2571 [Pseudomonadota bacterium]|jgi:predicted amidophosphoribosyltransferase